MVEELQERLKKVSSKELVLKPMFGAIALYLEEKIIFILREKPDYPKDNGVWFATTPDHHQSLKRDFPTLRDIELFGGRPTSWQNLPVDSKTFEEDMMKACRLVIRGDERIGKIPAKKNKPKDKTINKSKSKRTLKVKK